MKKKQHNYLVILFCVLMYVAPESIKGQDPNFSHFMMSPIYYNPAACGIREDLELRFSYRNLWYGIRPLFHTAKFSGSIYEPKIGGIGLIAMTNVKGDGFLRTTNIGIAYAYKVPLVTNRVSLQFGLTSGFGQKSIDWSKLHFDDEFDKVMGQIYQTGFTPPDFNSVIYPDFDFGAIISTGFGKGFKNQTLYYNELGIAFKHITQPDHSLTGVSSKLPIKTVIHYKGVLKGHTNKDIYFTPAAMIEMQGGMRTTIYGVNAVVNPIFLGMWIRNRNVIDFKAYDAISICAGVLFNIKERSKITLSYNYDFTISRLAPGTLGSHEINVKVDLLDVSFTKLSNQRSFRRNRKRSVPCPHPGINF